MWTLATILAYFMFMEYSKKSMLRIMERIGSHCCFRTFHRTHLQPCVYLSSLSSCTPLPALLVPTTWNFLQPPECSLSSQTSRPFRIPFLHPEDIVSTCLHLGNPGFCYEPQMLLHLHLMQTLPGKLLNFLHSHSALLIPLSQHLAYNTTIIGSQAFSRLCMPQTYSF